MTEPHGPQDPQPAPPEASMIPLPSSQPEAAAVPSQEQTPAPAAAALENVPETMKIDTPLPGLPGVHPESTPTLPAPGSQPNVAPITQTAPPDVKMQTSVSPPVLAPLAAVQATAAKLEARSPVLNTPQSRLASQTPVLPPQPKPQVHTSPFEKLLSELQESPQSPSNWRKLVELAETSGDAGRIRSAYNALLQHYPNTPSAQIAFINHFLIRPETFTEAEELFRKFLRSSPSVDLCRFYLTYVRRVNSSPATREAVRQSYEFALNQIGQDKDSGDIWWDYVQFLNEGSAATPWEQQQKNDALRATLHRSIQIPLSQPHHTKLWEFLETFENSLSKIVAKKYIGELSPAYVQAKAVSRELRQYLGSIGLDREALPNSDKNQNGYMMPVPGQVPSNLYLPELPTFTSQERLQYGRWKAYLKWEESNPLMIDLDGNQPGVTTAIGLGIGVGTGGAKDGGRAVFIQRVQGVYKKAIIYMRWYPEIWFMFYMWTNSIGRQEEALAILKQGLEACPTSFLLTFAYAESLEMKGQFVEVHQLYDKFLASLIPNLEKLEAQVKREQEKNSPLNTSGPTAANGNTSISADGISSTNTSPNTSAVMAYAPSAFANGDVPGFIGSQSSGGINQTVAHLPGLTTNPGGSNGDSQKDSFDTQASNGSQGGVALTPLQQEFKDHQSEYSLVYINLMRFTRRAEGIKSGRGIFSRARRDKWVGWEMYEAAAMMEYHCSDDQTVPNRIFEKGVEMFPSSMPLILSYLGFLINSNDENNARALFEKVVSGASALSGHPTNPTIPNAPSNSRFNFTPQELRPLWDKWARYVYAYGDLESCHSLEKRIADIYGGNSPNVTGVAAPTGGNNASNLSGLNVNAGSGGSSGEPPIKRFAQRYMYGGIDGIANRDLGLGMAKKTGALGPAAPSGASRTAGGNPAATNLLKPSAPQGFASIKRPHSPDSGFPGSGGPSRDHKRQDRREDRDRDRYSRSGPSPHRGGGGGGRYSPPPRERERDRGRDRDDDRDRKRPPPRNVKPRGQLSPAIRSFIARLPNKNIFDGPIFRTDDLLKLMRDAQVPSTKQLTEPHVTQRPPPPGPSGHHGPKGGGRPPPDYSPYQGPGGGRRGGRH